jgi:hypothetical protein
MKHNLKAITLKAISVFCLLTSEINAQNTFPISGNAGVGTLNPNAALEINSTYQQLINCGNYSGTPGLKIERFNLPPCPPCNGCGFPSNTPPNIFEVITSGNSFTVPTSLPVSNFIINYQGNTGIGMNPIINLT